MSKVIAVIGAGYGDEGKGLMTDYYASLHDDAVVIRSNGGAQAGHTVVTPEGQRHVFSHFGAGTFAGRPTFLSEFFVVNPLLFMKEHKEFYNSFGFKPEVYVDPYCLVTTPYDMFINQSLETGLNHNRHGSVGVGFGETLQRQKLHSEISVSDLNYYNNSEQGYDILTDLLKNIIQRYVPSRIVVTAEENEMMDNPALRFDFIKACEYMLDNITLAEPNYFKDKTLIFEGAQGLLLDMDYGYFPHVTRSNCGMKNISTILDNIVDPHDITVNYVTRAYTTRHGAGPLAHENDEIFRRYDIKDETNVTNEFQGSLRFAPFNPALFQSVTNKDFLNYAPLGSKKVHTITCLDQLSYNYNVQVIAKTPCDFSKKVYTQCIVPEMFEFQSTGNTRDNVTPTEKIKL